MDLSKPFPILVAALAAFTLTAGAETPDLSKLPPAAKIAGVTYAKDIKPLFDASCIRCHGEQRPKAGLKLTTLEGILKGSKDEKVVVPGNSKESPLVIAVARIDDDTAMPPKRGGGGKRGGPNGPGGGPERKGPPPGESGEKGGDQPRPNPGQGPGGQKGRPENMPKPLTTEQVSLVRAWVDQGAK